MANAYQIKAVPGRKIDVKDCEWIANLLAQGSCTNRAHKLLQTANIKLANVVADVLGVSGRAMLDALVAGETDPEHLAKGSLSRR